MRLGYYKDFWLVGISLFAVEHPLPAQTSATTPLPNSIAVRPGAASFISPIAIFRQFWEMNKQERGTLQADQTGNIKVTGTPITFTKPATISRSPVAIFRQLLAMNQEEQAKFLANKTQQDRDEIMAKVNEYKALRPDERELKLKATELRWYLRPFLYAPETNRGTLLATVPSKDRKLVEDRLHHLDQLPAEAKKQLQTNEAVVMYLSVPFVEQIFVIGTNSDILNEGLQRLQAMPEEQRQKTLNGFKEFFEFSFAEKEKIIHTLSEPERQGIEKILRQYENLSAPQREACIQSFKKLANMRKEERQQFLNNADSWRKLTPEERQQFKSLVEELNALPPSPPDFPPILIDKPEQRN